MMRWNLLFLLLLFVAAPLPDDVRAQRVTYEIGAPVRLVLKDGSVLVGSVVRVEEGQIHFRTTGGAVLTIPEDQVDRVERASAGVLSDSLQADPSQSRLFISPTGRAIPEGQAYLAVFELFMPFFGYGISDRFGLSGGISLVPGSPIQVAYLAPKLTVIEQKGISLSVGVLGGTLIGDLNNDDWDIERPLFGILYGAGTYSGARGSLTTGVAMPFADGDLSDRPALVIGGDYAVSPAVKLITENYIVPGETDGQLFMGGVRFVGQRLTVDLGGITHRELMSDSGLPFIPWVGFAYVLKR